MKLQREDYITHFEKLFQWIADHEFRSHDICDVTATPLYLWLQKVNQRSKYGKYIYFPFYKLARDSPGVIRKTAGIRPRGYPQSTALIITALTSLRKKTGDTRYDADLLRLLEELVAEHRGGEDHMAWGQPYDWYSRKKIPAHTPRTTVTTQAAHALLDAFDTFQDEKYLDWAWKAGMFMIHKMSWSEDQNGNVCFPYTAIDRYHIHNANVLAAALLVRLASYRKNDQFTDLAHRAYAFTASHQNQDGSWFYWAPPDRILGKIDHYHTGFVLESYQLGANLWEGVFPFGEHLQKGLDFYEKVLFTKDLVPKMTSTELYPIDIQSCAQALITLGTCLPESQVKMDKLGEIYNWVIENLYDPEEGYFYYRVYRNKVDTTPYLRWAESWMLRALTFLIS
jgi:hypothetical protein